MTDLRKAAEMALEVFDGPVLKDATEHAMRLRKACDLLCQALAQPEWVGLTDEEVETWRGNYDFFDSALVREVEAKLKEKNT